MAVLAISESIWTVIGTSPISFAIGVLTGFVLSNRYRITKRNGEREK